MREKGLAQGVRSAAGQLQPERKFAGNSKDVDHVLHPFTDPYQHVMKGPLTIVRGKGVFVWDDQGREYIEGMAGLWSTSLGFGDEELIEAAIRQMRTLSSYHAGSHKSTLPLAELAEKLKEIAPVPFSKVFFTSSGSEANDTQIRLLWYYNNVLGRPEKKKIISRRGAYHGSTVGSASLTGIASYQTRFDLPLPRVKHVSSPHYYRFAQPGETEEEFAARMAAELEEVILREGPETIAAFIAEPVMAAGGVILPPNGYFEKVQEVLAKYDIRFIADEVICGFGRTGRMWGSETYGLRPHSLTCAKALSSGYQPIGAVMLDQPMFEAILEGSRSHRDFHHGFTFSGHPVAAAVALRTLQLMEERNVIGHVQRVSPRFLKRLKALNAHPLIGDTRGVGLMGAVELVWDKPQRKPFPPDWRAGEYCRQRAEAHGLIIRDLGDTLAFCPPLVIRESEIDEMFDRFEKALADLEAWVWKKTRGSGID